MPSPSSQSTAFRDLMIAAVLAVFASTHDAAATVTEAQQLFTDSPVSGSTMWCILLSPRSQLREAVLDVARPPSSIATEGPMRCALRPGRSSAI